MHHKPIGGIPPTSPIAEPEFPQIIMADVGWMEGYGNLPEIHVKVDGRMPSPSACIWQQFPPHAAKNFSLVSYHEPWAQFRHINNPQDQPNFGGNMGGTFHLRTGEVLNTRCGWSSRAGVFNKDPKAYGLPGPIEEVIIYHPESATGMFGYSLELVTLHQIVSRFLPELFLVRHDMGNEPTWVISTEPDRIVKPSGYVCR